MKVNTNYNTSPKAFRGGLTPQIANEIKNLNPKLLEKEFAKYGVICDFKNSKTIAGGINYAVNLCQEAFEKYNLPFNILPPTIKVLEKKSLVSPEDAKYFGLCTWSNMQIEKNDGYSKLGSIYINQLPVDDIKIFDKDADSLFQKRILSTDHFLGRFLHELIHNIHLNLLIAKSNLTDNFDLEKHVDFLTNEDLPLLNKLMVKTRIGEYASTSHAELFPEVIVKMVTDSLKENSLELKNNPLDKLKDYPKTIQKFVESELNLF